MSGPKSSRYTLSAEQRRRILEEQRQQRKREEERRRYEAESSRKADLLSKIHAESEKLAEQIDRLRDLKKESGYDLPALNELIAEYDKEQSLTNKIKASTAESSLQLKTQNDQLAEILRRLTSQYSACTDQVSQITYRYRQELDNIIAKGFYLSFSGIGTSRRKDVDTQIKQINEAISKISDLNLSDELLEHLAAIREKANSITDQSYLKNFYSIVIIPYVKKCKEYAALQAEHDELIIQYAILASECGVTTKPVPYTKEGLEFVKDEIATLETRLLELKEREFIKEALDEAMREMGYDLVGNRDVTKHSGKRIRHELYSLDNGTAVDITYSENGQITMELGGIDQIDRQPDLSEAEQLVEDMESFCSDYAELSRKLAARGIQTKHISLMPATAEYAQIFNLNDYDIHREVDQYSATTHKRKTTSALHKEN